MTFTRRRFLTGAAAVVAGPLLADRQRSLKTVSIFHTTDLHGHILPTQTYDGIGNLGGLARCASQMRQWKRESPDHLTLDIGDVYQGSMASYQSQGKVMIDLFNKLSYDGWVLGNHEFDWGLEVVAGAIARSQAPVITGNVSIDGRPSGAIDSGPLQNLTPWQIKEVGGFRIGLAGLVTPGLPYWLRPELLKGLEVHDPVEILKVSIAALKAQNVDAIVVLGHMGWRRADDYANRVQNLLKEVEGIDLYIGGHSHRDQPSWYWSNVLCTQANYFGIHCGRVDLSFDLESRKLVNRRAWTVLMDERFALDPLVIESATPALEKASAHARVVIGHVKEVISARGRRSPFWEMLCRSFLTAAKKQKIPADLVYHGTFDTPDVEPGEKTIADAWKWIPYENFLVRAELTGSQIQTILREGKKARFGKRDLYGMDPKELDSKKRYSILFNSYDSQSGGRKLMKLREILEEASSKTQMLPINTREAVIDYFADH